MSYFLISMSSFNFNLNFEFKSMNMLIGQCKYFIYNRISWFSFEIIFQLYSCYVSLVLKITLLKIATFFTETRVSPPNSSVLSPSNPDERTHIHLVLDLEVAVMGNSFSRVLETRPVLER